MKKSTLALLLASLGALPALALGAAQDYRIDHMDPPSWWTGMRNSKL